MADSEALNRKAQWWFLFGSSALSNLWKSGEYSDLTTRAGDQVFKVHRALVAPRSDFFKKALNSSPEGSHFREGQSGEIVLGEDDPAMVRRMLEFLYLSMYSTKEGSSTTTNNEDSSWPKKDALRTLDSVSALLIHASMVAMADKYQIESLDRFARISFLADFQGCLYEADAFVAIVELVYSTTPTSLRSLRDIILDHQSAMLVACKMDMYRKFVKDPEAFLDFAIDVLHQAKRETKPMN